MDNIFILSLFGDFKKYETGNLDGYIKLIEFMGRRDYKASTVNELIMKRDGQPQVVIMPLFNNNKGSIIEISSNRINFQLNSVEANQVEQLADCFKNEMFDLVNEFIWLMGINANRVALNCDIYKKNEAACDIPVVSSYYTSENQNKMTIRNSSRSVVNEEEINIITTKSVDFMLGESKYSYDLNTLGEKRSMRFDKNNIMVMFESLIDIVVTIERGMI